MPRVASLYLPNLAVDRLRRADARRARPPEPQDDGRWAEEPVRDQHPAAAETPEVSIHALAGGDRVAEVALTKERARAQLQSTLKAARQARAAGIEPTQAGAQTSGPGGWRPGARWAQDEADADPWLDRRLATKRNKRATLQAEIDTLPLHQRPAMRELGRRSEAAPVPFRAMPADEVGGLLVRDWEVLPPPRPCAGVHLAASNAASGEDRCQPDRGPRHGAGATDNNILRFPHPLRDERRGNGRANPNPVRAEPVEAPAFHPAEEEQGSDKLGANGEGVTCPQSPATPVQIKERLTELGLALNNRPRLAREGFNEPGGTGAGSAGPRQAETHEKNGTHVRYDLQGAFWHTGRTLGQAVRRATEPQPDHRLAEPTPLPPLVTAIRQGSKTVIAAACPAAQALGLHAGHALTLARASVPGLDVRDADPAGDAAFLQRLARFAARRWTPGASVSGTDGMWLDLTGVAHLHGGENHFCRRLVRFLGRLGCAARVAVADTAGAAHALARFGGVPIMLCAAGAQGDAMAPLPIAALRIGREAVDPLRRLGLERVGDLLAIPRGPLVRRFGAALICRLDQALGRVPEPITPIDVPETPRAIRRLLEPISTPEAIAQVIGDLCTDLCATLTAHGLGARRLLLTCRRVDGVDQPVAIGTARATRDARHLAKLLSRRIETIEPGFGIEAMALAAWHREPLGAQAVPGALAGEPAAPDLAPLVDQLAGRLGARRLYRLVAVESDVPERSVTARDPLGAGLGWPPEWPRPTRLLTPPEPVQNVMAEVPDHYPIRFTWRGRTHRVIAGDGPERVFGEWWRRAGEMDAVRDYFRVEDADGHRFWLFRRGDGVDGRAGDLSWHMQGLFG